MKTNDTSGSRNASESLNLVNYQLTPVSKLKGGEGLIGQDCSDFSELGDSSSRVDGEALPGGLFAFVMGFIRRSKPTPHGPGVFRANFKCLEQKMPFQGFLLFAE